MIFKCDTKEASSNQKKHRIYFEESQNTFLDNNELLIDDPNHFEDENHFIILGLSSTSKMLVFVILIGKMTKYTYNLCEKSK